MPPIPGIVHWHSLIARHAKTLRTAFHRATQLLEEQLLNKTTAKLEPVFVRNTPRSPLHPVARIKQGQNRWYSSARKSLDGFTRQFSTEVTSGSGSKFIDRSAFPKSRVATYISRSSGRAPFASTLRPNLTGGALGRTAGGYTIGAGRGGARYFSHAPAAQAQVVQNVSQAVRAFFISGHKAQFDGYSSNGEKRFKAVSTLQRDTSRHIQNLAQATPGSWIDFAINPTITALTPLGAIAGLASRMDNAGDHLNTDGLLEVLSVDFSRVLKDLATTMHDLKRLSSLGDLPITYEDCNLRVHFPGCDAQTVERLCQELNVTRGRIVQDPAFDSFSGVEIALLFPFAPNQARSDSVSDYFEDGNGYHNKQSINMHSLLSESPAYSLVSEQSGSSPHDVVAEDLWTPSRSSFETVNSETFSHSDPLEYQGFEGLYRFLEELNSVR